MGRYKVVFLGMAVAGPDEEDRLLKGLQKKFNLSPEKAESLLQRVPIVVKKGISKEEMERYVNAFEEFGGRLRVEEEPATEADEIGPPSKIEKKLYTGPVVTCPQCGFEQPETDECIKCGVIFSKYFHYQDVARSFEGKVREISSEDQSSPWESGENMIQAFIRTAREVLFSPTKFFRKMADGEGYWTPLIYGIICGIIGFGIAILWQWLLISQFIPIPIFSIIPYSFALLIITVALPFVVVISVFIGSAVTHVSLMIVGGNKKGFESTFRVISYSWSGFLFAIIPVIGSMIGSIYTLILTIIGVRESNEISTGKAVLAVLLPAILLVCFFIIFILLIPLFLGSIRFSGGVGV